MMSLNLEVAVYSVGKDWLRIPVSSLFGDQTRTIQVTMVVLFKRLKDVQCFDSIGRLVFVE